MHFKNHANISYEIYSKIKDNKMPDSDITIVKNLIKRDMEIHLMKADDIPVFCLSIKDALSLLVTGLCEINSNASLFGGIESTSFKIKFKQINRRGRSILEFLKKSY